MALLSERALAKKRYPAEETWARYSSRVGQRGQATWPEVQLDQEQSPGNSLLEPDRADRAQKRE